jgi:hypothetical protein
MVVPNLDVMAVQLRKTRERPQRVKIVVEYGNFHVHHPF